jgi:hypothetical protein
MDQVMCSVNVVVVIMLTIEFTMTFRLKLHEKYWEVCAVCPVTQKVWECWETRQWSYKWELCSWEGLRHHKNKSLFQLKNVSREIQGWNKYLQTLLLFLCQFHSLNGGNALNQETISQGKQCIILCGAMAGFTKNECRMQKNLKTEKPKIRISLYILFQSTQMSENLASWTKMTGLRSLRNC